ncbi:MAG: cytosolic protein [Deltaproteobacteria bacterium]|nr:cytosolic protein [Deltaproteobacteria bacterium]
MECKQDLNLKSCNCSYEPCSRKGICCDCLRYHLKNRQLPGCCFPDEAERTYDRSFEHFARLVQEKQV